MKKEEFQQNMKDRMQQFEDGGLRLLKKGQKGIVHAIFSRFGLVLLLMLLQVGVLWSVFRWFGGLLPHYFGGSHQAERLAATYGKRYTIHCANFAPHSPEHTLPHRKRTAHITKIKKRRRGGRHAYSEAEKETEKRQTRKSASILVPFLVKKLVFYH